MTSLAALDLIDYTSFDSSLTLVTVPPWVSSCLNYSELGFYDFELEFFFLQIWCLSPWFSVRLKIIQFMPPTYAKGHQLFIISLQHSHNGLYTLWVLVCHPLSNIATVRMTIWEQTQKYHLQVTIIIDSHFLWGLPPLSQRSHSLPGY